MDFLIIILALIMVPLILHFIHGKLFIIGYTVTILYFISILLFQNSGLGEPAATLLTVWLFSGGIISIILWAVRKKFQRFILAYNELDRYIWSKTFGKFSQRYYPGDHTNQVYKQYLLLKSDLAQTNIQFSAAIPILDEWVNLVLSDKTIEQDFRNDIENNRYTHIGLTYLVMYIACKKALYTGQYHFYRGSLTSVGGIIKRVADGCITKLVSEGIYTEEEAYNERSELSREIRSIG